MHHLVDRKTSLLVPDVVDLIGDVVYDVYGRPEKGTSHSQRIQGVVAAVLNRGVPASGQKLPYICDVAIDFDPRGAPCAYVLVPSYTLSTSRAGAYARVVYLIIKPPLYRWSVICGIVIEEVEASRVCVILYFPIKVSRFPIAMAVIDELARDHPFPRPPASIDHSHFSMTRKDTACLCDNECVFVHIRNVPLTDPIASASALPVHPSPVAAISHIAPPPIDNNSAHPRTVSWGCRITSRNSLHQGYILGSALLSTSFFSSEILNSLSNTFIALISLRCRRRRRPPRRRPKTRSLRTVTPWTVVALDSLRTVTPWTVVALDREGRPQAWFIHYRLCELRARQFVWILMLNDVRRYHRVPQVIGHIGPVAR